MAAMQNKPTQLTLEYRQWLNQNAIPGIHQSHYIRWLHMYLSHCAAERLVPLSPASLDIWLLKIAVRYPSSFLQNQAQATVKLYFALEAARQTPLMPSQPDAGLLNLPAAPEQTLVQTPTELSGWRELFIRIQSDPSFQQLSRQTRRNYRSWMQRFRIFCDPLPPARLSNGEFKAFVSDLAQQNLAEKSIQQAVCALRLLYRKYLNIEPLTWGRCLAQILTSGKDLNQSFPIQAPQIPPQVISTLLRTLDPPFNLLAELIWTYGMELSDCLKIRLRDLSPSAEGLRIYRRGKPSAQHLQVPHHLVQAHASQRHQALRSHHQDLANGSAGVFLDDLPPGDQPADPLDPNWQYLFPAHRLTRIGPSGESRRYHLHPSLVQARLRQASAQIGVPLTASRLRTASPARRDPAPCRDSQGSRLTAFAASSHRERHLLLDVSGPGSV